LLIEIQRRIGEAALSAAALRRALESRFLVSELTRLPFLGMSWNSTTYTLRSKRTGLLIRRKSELLRTYVHSLDEDGKRFFSPVK